MDTLMASRPWLVGVGAPDTYPTRMDDIEEYQDWLYLIKNMYGGHFIESFWPQTSIRYPDLKFT